MKKNNKFFSSCSKLTRSFALVLFAAVLFSGMVSCKQNSGEDDNIEPEVYTAQPENSISCGAYSLAYYLAKTNQIKYSEIGEKAEDIYNNGNIKFPDGTELDINSYHFNCSGTSDPAKMKNYIDSNELATSATLKLIADVDNNTNAEDIIIALASPLNFNIPAENRIANFEAGFNGCDYCIEILYIGNTGLHYILTYKKGDEFYSRDPADGKEYKRSQLDTDYAFTNSGIFIKK